MDTDYAGVVLALCPTLFGSSDGYATAVELVGGIDALRYVECDQLVSVQPGHLAVTDISDIQRLERVTSRFAVLHVQYLHTFCREYASGLGRGLFRFPTVPGYYYSRHLAGHDLYLTGYGCARRSAGRQRERASLAAKAAAMGARLYTQGSPAALLARLHRAGVEEAKSQRSATQGPSALTPSAAEESAGGLLIIVPSSMHLLRFLRACDARGTGSTDRVRGVPDELPRLFAEHCVSASFVHDLFAAASQQDARAVLRAQRGGAYALRLFEGVAFHTNGCALLQESGERADRCAAGADAGETSQILQLIERHDSLAALPSPAAAPLLDGLLSQRIGPSQDPDHGLPRALAALGISACSDRATSMLFFDTDGDAPIGPGVGPGIGAGMDADGGAGGVGGAGGYSPSTAFYAHAGMRTPRLLRLYDGRRRAYAPVFTYTQPLLGYYTRLVDTLVRPPAPASPDSGSRISGAGAPARACLFAALYASPHFASLARLLRPKPIILSLYGEDDPDALLRDAHSALYAALNLPPAVVQEYARLWAPAAAGLEPPGPPGPPEPAPKAPDARGVPDAQGPQGSEHDLLLAALRLLMDNVCVVPYTLAVSEDFVTAFRDRAFVVADLQLVYNVESEVSTLLAAAGAGAGGVAGGPNQNPGTTGLTTLRRAASKGTQGLVLQAFRRRRAAALPQARRLFAELQAFMTQSAARVQGCLWLQVLFEQALHSVLDTRARPGVIAQTALTPFLLQDAQRQVGSAGAGGGLACCAWLGTFADSAWKVCMHKGVSDEEFGDPLRMHGAEPGPYLLMSAECVAGALCRAPPPPHGAPPQLRQMAAILRRPGSLARLLRSLFKGLGVAALGLERAFAAAGLGVPGPLPYPPLDEACAALAELCGHGEGGAATALPVWYPALSGAAAPAPLPEDAHPGGGGGTGGSGGSAAHVAAVAAVLRAHSDRAVDVGVFLERALGSCGNYAQSLEAAGCAALQGLSQAAGLPEFVDIGMQLLSERDAPQSTRYSLNSVQHSAMQDYLSANTEHTHDSSATDERFRLRRVN